MQNLVLPMVILLVLIYIGESRLAASYFRPKPKAAESRNNTAKNCQWVCHFPGGNAVATGNGNNGGEAVANGGSVGIAVGNGQSVINSSTQHPNANSAKPMAVSNSITHLLAIANEIANNSTATTVGNVGFSVGNNGQSVISSSTHSSNGNSIKPTVPSNSIGHAIAIANGSPNGPAVANGGSVHIAVGDNGQLVISSTTQRCNGNCTKPTVRPNVFGNAVAITNGNANSPAIANGGSVGIAVGNGQPGIGGNTQLSNGRPGSAGVGSNGSSNGRLVISGAQLGGNAAAISGNGQPAVANGSNAKVVVRRSKHPAAPKSKSGFKITPPPLI